LVKPYIPFLDRTHQEDTMKVFAGASLAIALAAWPAAAQNVKITPLGSHQGELCAQDRATLFEDPTGVRILYDVGHTLTGPDDPRLGNHHLVLVEPRPRRPPRRSQDQVARGRHLLRRSNRTGAQLDDRRGRRGPRRPPS
jgi:hypothetical protein